MAERYDKASEECSKYFNRKRILDDLCLQLDAIEFEDHLEPASPNLPTYIIELYLSQVDYKGNLDDKGPTETSGEEDEADSDATVELEK